MHSRTLSSAVLAGAAALACLACSDGADKPAPEHVLLIVVDTLRADHLQAWGYGRETSPALAALAARGVRFANAVSQCSWTSPSMVSLMTGQYIAGERLSIPSDRATLAECFQKGGYQTAAFISNDIVSAENQFARGFQVFEQMQPYAPDDPIVEWIRSSAGRKTFTYVHLNEPHDPYQPPDEKLWHYKKESAGSLRPGRLDFYRSFSEQHQLGDFEGSIQTIAEEIGGYDDDVNYSDRRIAALLGALEASGQAARTAVVVTADHGEGLWTREAYDVGQRHEKLANGSEQPTLVNVLMNTHGSQVNRELIHVPLLIAAPGLPRGEVVEAWVENVDVVPTLLELCDLPLPGGVQGQSLLPLIAEPARHAKPFVFSQTRFVSSVIDQHGLQLVLPTELGRCQLELEPQLFDLAADPEARVDLAARRPADVERLTRWALERRATGIPGEHLPLSAANEKILRQLGYLDGSGVVETHKDQSAVATPDLVLMIVDPKAPCIGRLEAARALAGRELDEAQRAALTAQLGKEDAASVRTELQRILGH